MRTMMAPIVRTSAISYQGHETQNHLSLASFNVDPIAPIDPIEALIELENTQH
jgi:hypothetical protein